MIFPRRGADRLAGDRGKGGRPKGRRAYGAEKRTLPVPEDETRRERAPFPRPTGASVSSALSAGLGLVVAAGVALQQHGPRAGQPDQAGLGDLEQATDGPGV